MSASQYTIFETTLNVETWYEWTLFSRGYDPLNGQLQAQRIVHLCR